MTPSMEEQTEEPADPTSGDWPGVERRPLLKALGAGAAFTAGSGVATSDGDQDVDDDEDQVDQPEGFKAEVVAPHATFPDNVAAAFDVIYEDGAEVSAFLHDASTVVIATVVTSRTSRESAA